VGPPVKRRNPSAPGGPAADPPRTVEPADPADPDHPNRLAGLSIALRLRFERTRNWDDLDEAISLDRAAACGAARALHAAASRLRARGFPPMQWAPYIHSGP